MRKVSNFIISVGALFTFAGPVYALQAKQVAQKEVVVVGADGQKTVTYEDVKLITPGETVVYRLEFMNDKEEAATGISLTMPVPEVIDYIEDSASASVPVDLVYSADAGKSFAKRDELLVLKNGDKVPALNKDITHIRWDFKGAVNPGESGSLIFKGVLK